MLVDSNDERLKITIGPSGAAMENDYRADHRLAQSPYMGDIYYVPRTLFLYSTLP